LVLGAFILSVICFKFQFKFCGWTIATNGSLSKNLSKSLFQARKGNKNIVFRQSDVLRLGEGGDFHHKC